MLARHVLASQPGESDQRQVARASTNCLKACHVSERGTARCRCSVPALSTAIYELLGAWPAMSHICLRAARRNTPTVLSLWPAMSFPVRQHSGRLGDLLACHVSRFQAREPGMAPSIPS